MTPRDYALIAQEAYTAAPDVGIADSASRAIVRPAQSGLIVAFPGTDNVPGWIADLQAIPKSVPGAGDVHEGFWNAWQAIAPAVTSAVGTQPVTFVGHSLGAALAIMAAVSYTLAGKPPAAVYGFEPPRVCTGLEVATLLARVPVFLYRNGNDVVTDLPEFWHHAAALRHIGPSEFPIPNVHQHFLDKVITSLGAT